MEIDELSTYKKQEFIVWHIIDSILRINENAGFYKKFDLIEFQHSDEFLFSNICTVTYKKSDYKLSFRDKNLDYKIVFDFNFNKKINRILTLVIDIRSDILSRTFNGIYEFRCVELVFSKGTKKEEYFFNQINLLCQNLIEKDDVFKKTYLTYYDIFNGHF